jgi:CRP-like cAMP-binding protein
VYFVRDAIVSLVVAMADGSTVESATVGNEGVVGLGLFLGDGTATECMVVQITGQAAGMSAADFREAIRGSPRLQSLVGQYTLALMNHLARTAGCNRLHAVQQRYARWLLMSADRLGRTNLPLTHESLAILLGVRRASVSEAAEMLQRAGLIAYQRGRIAILDREGLERAACEDYRLSQDGYDRIYG